MAGLSNSTVNESSLSAQQELSAFDLANGLPNGPTSRSDPHICIRVTAPMVAGLQSEAESVAEKEGSRQRLGFCWDRGVERRRRAVAMETKPGKEEDSATRGAVGVVTKLPVAEGDMAVAGNKAAAEPVVVRGAKGRRRITEEDDDEGGAGEPRLHQNAGGAPDVRLPRPTRDRRIPELPAEQEYQELADLKIETQAHVKALYDKETAILELYRKYGFANEMIEIDSDEEEGN